MSGTHWTSHEDIDADFAAVSDLYDDTIKYKKPSVQERKARSKPSIYIDNDEEEFNNEPYIPRGRGAAFLNKHFKLPGGLPSFMQRHEDITNDIRQSCEFRFDGNDIVQSLNGSTEAKFEEKLSNSPASSLSSVKSSSTSWYTSSESPSKEIVSKNQSESPTCTSKEDEIPPPLYDIIKFGYNKKQKRPSEKPPSEKPPEINGFKKTMENKLGTTKMAFVPLSKTTSLKMRTEEKMDVTNMFSSNSKTRFDIESHQEFPALN